MKALRLIIIFGAILMTPQTVAACFCGAEEEANPEGVYRTHLFKSIVKAGAIFTAKASKVTSDSVVFETETLWKGQVGERFVLHSSAGSCDLNFETGGTYLIYARRYRDVVSGQERWTTSRCDRSKRLVNASEDIKQLRSLKLKKGA